MSRAQESLKTHEKEIARASRHLSTITDSKEKRKVQAKIDTLKKQETNERQVHKTFAFVVVCCHQLQIAIFSFVPHLQSLHNTLREVESVVATEISQIVATAESLRE